MRVRDLTSEDVKAFALALAARYGASIQQKLNNPVMETVGSLLQDMGVLQKQSFMSDYCTTLGRTIYANFRVGVEDTDGVSLPDQVAVLCHEATHVEQFDRGAFTFTWLYITNTEQRAVLEAEAYVQQSLFEWLYAEQMSSPSDVEHWMASYGVPPQDAKLAKQLVESAQAAVVAGGVVPGPSAWAHDFLKGRGVFS
jgi:hypothetical protein